MPKAGKPWGVWGQEASGLKGVHRGLGRSSSVDGGGVREGVNTANSVCPNPWAASFDTSRQATSTSLPGKRGAPGCRPSNTKGDFNHPERKAVTQNRLGLKWVNGRSVMMDTRLGRLDESKIETPLPKFAQGRNG